MTALPLPAFPLETDTPLWRFALSLWQDPETESAGLALQDRGWVVSHLLVAAFLAREGRLWDGREPEPIAAFREQMTGTLRRLRLCLPRQEAGVAGLRKAVAAAELEAERVELAWWYQWVRQHPLPPAPQEPLALLAANLIAAGDEPGGDLALLHRFAHPLVPANGQENFRLELDSAYQQQDRP